VLHQVHAEIILQHKQFFLKRVLSLHPVLVLNSLFPHTHELPALELFEKRQLFNVVVRITLDQPLSQGQEFDRGVVLIQC
jgi:hypothetical protein